MHHHRLRPAADHRMAVRHGDAEILVRRNDGRRQPPAIGLAARVALGDGREVRPAIDEKVVDAARGEQAEERVRRALWYERFISGAHHLSSSRKLALCVPHDALRVDSHWLVATKGAPPTRAA